MDDLNDNDFPRGVGDVQEIQSPPKKKKSLFRLFVFSFVLLVILGIVGFGVYEYLRIAPSDARFTNVTSNSVTVSWNTKSATSGTALVFEGNTWLPVTILGFGGERFYDTRDVRRAELEAVKETSSNIFDSENIEVSMDDFEVEVKVEDMGEYYTHHVTIVGLASETEYSFMVGDSLLHWKVKDVEGIGVVSTLEVPNSIEAPSPAYGVIKDAQNKETIEEGDLLPVVDGVVYFNLLDEFSGEKSSVYSSALNEDGNWYMDISGIRGEDGNSFFDRYTDGEITNILAEISIDAGPSGKWEGILNSDVIAPAEMIVINDPLQNQIDGVGIKRVDASVLGEFSSKIEASGCQFAGYCGPCYEGVLTNPCPCPKASLDNKPGCKGEESGTMESAISAVAGAKTGCSGGGPGAYVYFDGVCRQCKVYARDPKTNAVISYRWTTSVDDKTACDDNKSGKTFTPTTDTDPADGPISNCVNTPQADISNGSRCCRAGRWGTGIPWPSDKCPEGENCSSIFYCGTSGSKGPGAACPVTNGKGRTTSTGCSAYTCNTDYKLSYDTSKKVMVCVGAQEEVVNLTNIGCKQGDIGKLCNMDFTIDSQGIRSYCTDGNTCVKDGLSCSIRETYYTVTEGKYYKGECVPPISDVITENPEDLVVIEDTNIYSDSSCWKGASRGYYRILSDGSLQRCTNWGYWIDKPSSTGSKRCQDLYDLGSIVGVNCNLKGDFCSIYEEEDIYEDYYCDGKKWREWSSYKEEYSQTDIPAGPSPILDKGLECYDPRCVCPGNSTIDEGEYCPEVDEMACDDYSNLGKRCNESGYICRGNGEFETLETELDARRYYIEGGEGVVCVSENNKCYQGVNNRNKLVSATIRQSAGVFCQPDDSTSSTSNTEGFNSLKTSYVSRVLGLESDMDSIDFIIDSETGMVFDIDPGSYLIEYEGEYFTFEVRDYQLEGNDGSVLIYLDKNENGTYDEGIDVKISDVASKIQVTTLSKTHSYSLRSGFNFVSFPFLVVPSEFRTAASLLGKLNELYGDIIFSISKYDGGRWRIVGQNTVLYSNDDFQLLPGEGYVIKARRNVSISIQGQPVKYDAVGDNAPVTLFEGWNLVGIYGTGVKTYTAKSMIADINASNFTADNVSRWQKDRQMYDGFQVSEGQEYGFDFPINQLESYFVRIKEGRGNWQPKLRTQ